jgi:hypothetical protein
MCLHGRYQQQRCHEQRQDEGLDSPVHHFSVLLRMLGGGQLSTPSVGVRRVNARPRHFNVWTPDNDNRAALKENLN